MKKIAQCESGMKQSVNGVVVRSKTDDVGLFQINIPTWGKKAEELGYDIVNSREDNIKMAKYILDNQGLSAWTPSKKCWSMIK